MDNIGTDIQKRNFFRKRIKVYKINPCLFLGKSPEKVKIVGF